MAIHVQCDYCGQTIGPDDRMVGLDGRGVGTAEGGGQAYVNHGVGHYHGDLQDDGVSCWRRIRDAIEDMHAARAREREEQLDRADIWRRMSRERREALAFHVLGDASLVIREFADRMNRELVGDAGQVVLYQTAAGALVKRLWREGQLDRKAETFNKSRTRYRYSVSRKLNGAIADLERAYHDEEEA